MFSSGDGGVGDGDPNPATQSCFSNDGRNITKFLPAFPASYVTIYFDCMGIYSLYLFNKVPFVSHWSYWLRTSNSQISISSVTAVGGTTHIPEVAVSRFFSGGGFSNYVCLSHIYQLVLHWLWRSLRDLHFRIRTSVHTWPPSQREHSQASLIRAIFLLHSFYLQRKPKHVSFHSAGRVRAISNFSLTVTHYVNYW